MFTYLIVLLAFFLHLQKALIHLIIFGGGRGILKQYQQQIITRWQHNSILKYISTSNFFFLLLAFVPKTSMTKTLYRNNMLVGLIY